MLEPWVLELGHGPAVGIAAGCPKVEPLISQKCSHAVTNRSPAGCDLLIEARNPEAMLIAKNNTA
jgi:hypothetical protein